MVLVLLAVMGVAAVGVEKVGGVEVSLCVHGAEGRGPLSHDRHQGREKPGVS